MLSSRKLRAARTLKVTGGGVDSQGVNYRLFLTLDGNERDLHLFDTCTLDFICPQKNCENRQSTTKNIRKQCHKST